MCLLLRMSNPSEISADVRCHFSLPYTFVRNFNIKSFLCLSYRSRRLAMLRQLLSLVITPATTSFPVWCPQTPTRPRPWWTSSKPCNGTMCLPSLQRETMERVELTLLSRSLGRTVSVCSNIQTASTLFTLVWSRQSCVELFPTMED